MKAYRPPFRRAFGPAAACALAARAAFAAEPTAPSAVEVRRAEGALDCPDAAALADLVGRQLGRPALSPGPAPGTPTAFEVFLWGEGPTRRARLVARGERAGKREFADRGANCDGLTEALVATMVIALSDGATSPAPAPAPASEPTPEPAPAPAPELAPAPAPAPDAPPLRARFGVTLEVGIDLTTRVLGTLTPAGRSVFEVRPWPWFGVGVGALATTSSRFERGPGSTDIWLLAAELRACGGPSRRRPLGFAFCASSFAGAMQAQGRGYAPSREVAGGWVALALGPRLEGNLYGALGWTAHASALMPLWSDRFTVDSLGVVFDPPAVGAMVGGGLSLTIW